MIIISLKLTIENIVLIFLLTIMVQQNPVKFFQSPVITVSDVTPSMIEQGLSNIEY